MLVGFGNKAMIAQAPNVDANTTSKVIKCIKRTHMRASMPIPSIEGLLLPGVPHGRNDRVACLEAGPLLAFHFQEFAIEEERGATDGHADQWIEDTVSVVDVLEGIGDFIDEAGIDHHREKVDPQEADSHEGIGRRSPDQAVHSHVLLPVEKGTVF